MTGVEFDNVLDDLEGLDDADLRQLIEQAHMVAQLAEHAGWPLFCDYLIALTTKYQKRILGGYCEDIEVYRHMTGQVSGIREALEAPKRLMDRVQRMQEQAEQAKTPSDEIV